MFDLFFRPKHKRDMDRSDALRLIDRFGYAAYGEAKRRAKDTGLSQRNRRHWARVSRLVAVMQQKQDSARDLVPSE